MCIKLRIVFPKNVQQERLQELAKKAAELAEVRKKAREEALEWSQRHAESDEEKEKEKKKKPRGRARTEATGSADEGEPRKKRRGGKLKKEVDAGEEEAALFSGEEEDSKPAAKKVRYCSMCFGGVLMSGCSGPRNGLSEMTTKRKKLVDLAGNKCRFQLQSCSFYTYASLLAKVESTFRTLTKRWRDLLPYCSCFIIHVLYHCADVHIMSFCYPSAVLITSTVSMPYVSRRLGTKFSEARESAIRAFKWDD